MNKEYSDAEQCGYDRGHDDGFDEGYDVGFEEALDRYRLVLKTLLEDMKYD